jgi:hypothetical protein
MRTESLDFCYLALPDGPGPYPGVVVIHEASGLNDNIRDICRRFAAEGYAALGVDLFEGRNRAVCMARMFAGGMAGNRDRVEDLWARGEGMPAGGGGQRGVGRGDDDLRVQRRDEVANAVVQHMDGVRRQQREPGLGPGLQCRDSLQPAVLQNAGRDHDQRYLAQAGRPFQLAHAGADVDLLVRGELDRPVDPRPGVQPVIDCDLRLAGGIQQPATPATWPG